MNLKEKRWCYGCGETKPQNTGLGLTKNIQDLELNVELVLILIAKYLIESTMKKENNEPY